MDMLLAWAHGPAGGTLAFTLLVFAPFLGSFAALVAERVSDGRPFLLARSQCAGCQKVLAPAELVPLVSYALLRGRCRSCDAGIPWTLPAIEVLALGLALWAGLALGAEAPRLAMLATVGLGLVLLILSLIDVRTFLLPDTLTLPLILAGLGVTAVLAPAQLGPHAMTAAAGFGLFWALNEGYRLWRGQDGLGLGDAKLLAGAGAWLGPLALPSVILIAALAGLIAAGAARLAGHAVDRTTALPFGPFLALGFWIVWLHGPLTALPRG